MRLREFEDYISSHGFSYLRPGKGSHAVWANADGETFSFPTNGKIGKGLVFQFDRRFVKKHSGESGENGRGGE